MALVLQASAGVALVEAAADRFIGGRPTNRTTDPAVPVSVLTANGDGDLYAISTGLLAGAITSHTFPLSSGRFVFVRLAPVGVWCWWPAMGKSLCRVDLSSYVLASSRCGERSRTLSAVSVFP